MLFLNSFLLILLAGLGVRLLVGTGREFKLALRGHAKRNPFTVVKFGLMPIRERIEIQQQMNEE
jgi:hypothetical protein